jgi:hypothetical protein
MDVIASSLSGGHHSAEAAVTKPQAADMICFYQITTDAPSWHAT